MRSASFRCLRNRLIGCVIVVLLVFNLVFAPINIQAVQNIQSVQATSTITILPDGSIEPITAPIQRNGNIYTLIENITFNNQGSDNALWIQCSNMTFDGNGFALKNASSTCVYISSATNVTFKNTIITNAGSCGITFSNCRNCTVKENLLSQCNLNEDLNKMPGAIYIAASEYLYVTQNIVIENYNSIGIKTIPGLYTGIDRYHNLSYNIFEHVRSGIHSTSDHSVFLGNTIRNASEYNYGIHLDRAEENIIANNTISDCYIGIDLAWHGWLGGTVTGNIVDHCVAQGIRIDDATFATVSDNSVTNTYGNPDLGLGNGIDVDATNTIISRNHAVNNTLSGLLIWNDYNVVTENYAADNKWDGIYYTHGSNSSICSNYAANNTRSGIELSVCDYLEISANTAVNNKYGLFICVVHHNKIFDNEIMNNSIGLRFSQNHNNSIYHNHFTDNTQQVYFTLQEWVNSWDDGYPSGGNYWSDYTGADLYKGPNQDIPGSDGIGDTPYIIANNNVDRYPIITEPSPDELTISPNCGGNTGNVTVRITGTDFCQGMTVKLVRPVGSIIVGSNINIISSTQLTTSFNLIGVEPDTIWDLVVTYPDGRELTLEYAFKVMLGGEPVIYADILGLDKLRIGDSLTYIVRIYNRGIVDATDHLLEMYTDPALKILKVKDPDGNTIWDRVALEQTITEGQMQHPELWQGDSSQMVSEFLNTTQLYVPRLGAGDCLTLQVEVYAKIPYDGDDPLHLILAKVAIEVVCVHILSQIISSEMIFYGVDDWLVKQIRDSSYPITGSIEFTEVLVNYLMEYFGPSVSAGVKAFGKWGTRALTGLSLVIETVRKIDEHNKKILEFQKSIQPVYSYDPNDKAGPTGYGTEVYVPIDTNLTFMIRFENLANATAEAENIVIYDILDTDLNWSTLRIGGSSHPDKMSYNFESTTGTITWTFSGIDLPPNINAPEGEGWVSYSVKPKTGLATGTEIRNKAAIFFDFNPPIETPETLHTIDASAPESAIHSLHAQSNSSFVLSWSGTDAGSGVKAYSIYYSDNDGPWVVWLLQTQDATAMFNGQVGHTYRFYSRALDQVGNHEEAPQDPDTTTTVIYDNSPPVTQPLIGSPKYVDLAETVYLTPETSLGFTSIDNEGGYSGVNSTNYRLFNLTYDTGWQQYSGSFYLNELTDGSHILQYRSTDWNGNIEAAQELSIVVDSRAPEASMVIDDGAISTNSTEIILHLTATDVLQDTIEVRFSNNNTTYTQWEVYAPINNWTLATGYGEKTVFVQFKDFLGHVSTCSSTIELIPDIANLLTVGIELSNSTVSMHGSVYATVTVQYGGEGVDGASISITSSPNASISLESHGGPGVYTYRVFAPQVDVDTTLTINVNAEYSGQNASDQTQLLVLAIGDESDGMELDTTVMLLGIVAMVAIAAIILVIWRKKTH